jgi:glycerol kinase
MGRTLFTVAFVADCDDDTITDLLNRMEHQWQLNMLRVLEIHDAQFDDLAEAFEFYGITAAPMRERV